MRILDNTAPRYRSKFTPAYTTAFFDTLSPEIKKYGNKRCKKLLTEFAEIFSDEVRNFRDGAELPVQLGVVFIGTCPRKKRLNPNWPVSTEYDKLLNHQNWESDQKTAKIFYTNAYVDGNPTFGNGQYWAFKAAQLERKKLKVVYREQWQMYAEVQPWEQISQKFRKDNFKMKKRSEDANYNPFE